MIVLDPKGDAADAAVSAVSPDRTCTVLNLAHPTCGFNPLAADAPADVIADYVVAALKNLFTDADIRASSDRYLRNAIIAVLAYDRRSTLWDAARLLSVGEEGYAYRRAVGARVRMLPEMKEISAFFTAELTAQLADARSTTTAKLDAPVNKLARLLNSASIKRVLLNESLRIDFDRIIGGAEVLVVKGALGAMGAGNTSVVMQLLVGMLDAALARQQDLVAAPERVAVALKVDEAPLVINRGFAETMALKRSAGLETVACWQADAQWADPQIRDQLDALFAHRVYFATASARDARDAVRLTMAEFSDTVRPGIGSLSTLGHPDVRMRLPKHHAIASWTTPAGRQPPFVAKTIPLRIDRERLALHAARQQARGGQHLADLRQPHWDRAPESSVRRGARVRFDDRRRRSSAPTLGRVVVSDQGEPPRREADSALGRSLPTTPAQSFGELVELDRAQSVRWVSATVRHAALDADAWDLDVLTLIGAAGHVLSTQIHRRFNAGRGVTTTQRRLKRLSDAGLVERLQFHRRDGGGVPMCYVLSARGAELINPNGAEHDPPSTQMHARRPNRPASAASARLMHARRQVHAAGWALALERALRVSALKLRGEPESVISPPLCSSPNGPRAIGPMDLRLPAGRTPHDFFRPQDGERDCEAEQFETVRPAVTIELPRGALDAGDEGTPPGRSASAHSNDGASSDSTGSPALDVMVELDDRLPVGRAAGKLARYDHFLAGWSAHVRRYGRRLEATPLVVFVCRDRARARECARAADSLLRACRAYAGEYPIDWEYLGRDAVVFVGERDVHEGTLAGYGVPRLPPNLRVEAAHGDPFAAEATAEPRPLLAHDRSPRA